jgi:hypothetical protein
MTKTPTITIFTLAAVTATVAVLAVHKYETHKVAASPVKPDYSALYAASSKQVKDLTTSNGVLQATDTQLAAQKQQLCTELAKAKVIEALCK